MLMDQLAATPEPLGGVLDLAVAIGAALVGGAIAVRLRQPAVVGYLVAGVAIGPFTPGFVGDVGQIAALAEIGVVLLLFALGVQFSLSELARVRRVVIPGGLAQIAIVLAVGAVAASVAGLEPGAALVVGACLSISSTLVVLKLLIERGELDSLHGRTAIGWMILQDIATIVFIAALPPLGGGDPIAPLVLAVARAGLFLALAWVVGTRLLPWLFEVVARLGSQELFLLAVFATALLAAVLASELFGLSLALGAFVAGLLVSGTAISHQAAAEVIPFRDLFAVLFFVSVGMLVDPAALVDQAPLVLVLVLIAVGLKGLLTAGFGRALGLPGRAAALLGALVAQVGEFSFILAQDALQRGILDPPGYNLVLGTAGISIVLSPFALRATTALVERRAMVGGLRGPADAMGGEAAPADARAGQVPATESPAGRSRGERSGELGLADERLSVVVLGAGRVGSRVVRAVRARGLRCVAVDRDQRRLEAAAALGAATLYGDAANRVILERAGLARARVLVVAIGDPLTARLAVERALAINPRLDIATRARGAEAIGRLRTAGVERIADPEVEAGLELARHALQRMGISAPELQAILTGLRRDAYGR